MPENVREDCSYLCMFMCDVPVYMHVHIAHVLMCVCPDQTLLDVFLDYILYLGMVSGEPRGH